MIKNQLSVFLENQNGMLSEITDILAKGNINLIALNIAETKDYGVLRLIVDDERRAAAILSEQGFVVSVNPIQVISVVNQAGGLNDVLQKLNKNDVGIEYMYSIFGEIDGKAYMVFKVDTNKDLEELI